VIVPLLALHVLLQQSGFIWQQLAGPSGPAEKAAPQSSTPK
jgi:hypothetical protein